MKDWEITKSGNLLLIARAEKDYEKDYKIEVNLSNEQRNQILKVISKNVTETIQRAKETFNSIPL